MTQLTGLTWGHKRAVDPLRAGAQAFAQRVGRPTTDWQVRDLGRFEHEPLHIIARQYDMVVFDHPFCGVIAASGCLRPLPQEWIDRDLGRDPAAAFVGRSYESYVYAGQLWGLPVDAACNHAVFRSDLLARYAAVPTTWSEVEELGRQVRASGRWLAIGAASHHGLIAAAALMANLDRGFPEGDRESFVLDRSALTRSVDAVRRIVDLSPVECLTWNSIAVQDAMIARDDLVYCPIVYGFATYAEPAVAAPTLSFSQLPGLVAPHAQGSIIGGAAIGISASSQNFDDALDELAFYASETVQTDIFGRHSGQPARSASWADTDLDRRFGGFFSGALPSMKACAMRPRFLGYQQFEKRAGDRMQHMMAAGLPTDAIVAAIVEEAEIVRAGALSEPYSGLAASAAARNGQD